MHSFRFSLRGLSIFTLLALVLGAPQPARAHASLGHEAELPVPSYHITFIAPVEAAVVGDALTISISISGEGAPIARVVFLADQVPIGSDTDAPYELEWDLSGISDDAQVLLEAVAQDAGGVELARGGVTITHQVGLNPGSGAGTEVETGGDLSLAAILVIAAVILLVAALALVLAIILLKKSGKGTKRAPRRLEPVTPGIVAAPAPPGPDPGPDAFTPGENALGVLVVLESDDPFMIGLHIEINRPVTTLGRRSSNDILFPVDGAVSRQHALIEARRGQVIFREARAKDNRRPTFGTFVNEQQIKNPVPLRNGDVVRLGSRVRLRFEDPQAASRRTDHTRDG
jgi:hypothetical protein